jgi:hypothetical protein
LKWSKVDKATGYKVYRYNNSQKKYQVIKTLGANKTKWADKNLKSHKIYKYKIVAFKNKKTEKIYSKKTYSVSARAYGKKARVVNVAKGRSVKIQKKDEKKVIGICSTEQLYVDLTEDIMSKKLKIRLTSNKVIWSSDNPSVLRVTKKGKIVSGTETGIATISARAHNGAIGKIKINVVNYARPENFQLYHGGIKEINSLLTDYKAEICDIADFFTINNKEDAYGDITVDKEGKIVGIPNIENISKIQNTITKLIEEYPYPIDIYFEKGCVIFSIGDNITVEYNANDTFDNNANKITEHWAATKNEKR